MKLSTVVGSLLFLAGTAPVFASTFTTGNLVVTRVGVGGTTTLSGAAAPTFLDEFSTVGSLAQTINMPQTASGANHAFVNTGSAASEGFIALSSNGNYLTLAGYDAPVGTAALGTTTSIANNRVIGRVDMFGNVDTTTALTDAYSGVAIRSAVSVDGTGFWMSGGGGGMRFASFGGTTTQLVETNLTNTRVANIFNGQLYVSAASGTFQGPGTVGSGLPTSGATATLLPGIPGTTASRYDFYFANTSTLYVADDLALTSTGGLQKWTFDGTNWNLAYTLKVNLTAGLHGLAGTVDGSGNVTLFATTNDSISATNGNKLVSVTDLGVSSPFTVLATAPGNQAFRGVEILTVPTPGALALMGMAGLVASRRRR